MPTCYEILHLPENATREEIEAAYRSHMYGEAAAQKARAGTPEERTRRFREVDEAYYFLSDAGRRSAYDDELARERTGASAVAQSRADGEHAEAFGIKRPRLKDDVRAGAGSFLKVCLGIAVALALAMIFTAIKVTSDEAERRERKDADAEKHRRMLEERFGEIQERPAGDGKEATIPRKR